MSTEAENRVEDSGVVVVIDDEPMVRDLLLLALEEVGLEVLTAETGAEAREIFSEKADSIRLVLLDLGLPDVHAGELFDEISARAPSAQYVLISGYGEAEARSRFGRSGIAAFLQKPFRIDALFDLAEELLGTRS